MQHDIRNTRNFLGHCIGVALHRLRDIKEHPDNYGPDERNRTIQNLKIAQKFRRELLRRHPEVAPVRVRQLSLWSKE